MQSSTEHTKKRYGRSLKTLAREVIRNKMGIATCGSAIAIGFCFPIIGGFLVALWFCIRWHQKMSRQIDDWLCLPIWVCVEIQQRQNQDQLFQLFLTGWCTSLLIGRLLFRTFTFHFCKSCIKNNAPSRSLQGCFRRATCGRSQFYYEAATCSCASTYNSVFSSLTFSRVLLIELILKCGLILGHGHVGDILDCVQCSYQTPYPFFYRRIFIGRIFNICNWNLIGISFLWLVYVFLSWILYCGTNLHADFEGGWAACDPWGFDIQMGVFCLDSFIDFFLLILPVPFVSDYSTAIC